MRKIISPLFYLPPIHCVTQYIQCDELIIEANENYQKGSFRNKCRIATAQGSIILSVPLRRGKHQALGIKNVLISNEENWRLQHWRSITTAYNNTPYFEHYSYLFEAVYTQQFDRLWEFNMAMMFVIQKCLGITLDYHLSEKYESDVEGYELDLRKIKRPTADIKPYPQVHEETTGFLSDMSIIDLIFHLGPEARVYLKH